MREAKFIGMVLAGVTVSLLLLTIFMPIISDFSGIAVTEVGLSPNADAYASTTAGLNYAPFFLYLVIPVIGVIAIVLKLRSSR